MRPIHQWRILFYHIVAPYYRHIYRHSHETNLLFTYYSKTPFPNIVLNEPFDHLDTIVLLWVVDYICN